MAPNQAACRPLLQAVLTELSSLLFGSGGYSRARRPASWRWLRFAVFFITGLFLRVTGGQQTCCGWLQSV